VSIVDNTLRISDHLFDQDALIFSELQSKKVSLEKESSKILTVSFDDFPYLGIWSKSAHSPFICIEPWQGIADHADHKGEFGRKEGIRRIKSGESESFAFQIEIHPLKKQK